MKTIIHSLSIRFFVNVLMIIFFGISAATGLIKPEGNHGRPHDFRNERIADDKRILTAGTPGRFEGLPSGTLEIPDQEAHEDTHVLFGIFWLALMVFHAIHHWNWFKKMFSVQHIRKNKLLTLTVVLFLVMALSGIVMWLDLIPRDIINIKEIHEFTGQSLLVLLAIHVIQRVKWYYTVPSRLFKRKTILAGN